MSRALIGCLLFAGCLPDPSGLRPGDAGALDASDAQAAADAGPGDAFEPVDEGVDPLAGCDPLLPCVRGCDDALFASVLFDPNFESFPDDMTRVAGTVEADGSALVFERDSSEAFSTARTIPQFSDALLCARFRMAGGGEGVSANVFALGLLTGNGGIELFVDGREEKLEFLSAEVLPDGVLLGRADYGWEATHEMVVLIYLAGDRAYAELFDLVTSRGFAFPGTYRGERRPAFGWYSAIEPKVLDPIHLLETRIGAPSEAALRVLE